MHSPPSGQIHGGRSLRQRLEAAPASDVVVVGGGIQGACIYHHLVRAGYRVLLIDRGDFGGGTSQASANLIWGGFLYLRDWEIGEVMRLSRCRDRMLRRLGGHVQPHTMRYVCGRQAHRRPETVQAVLWCYWMLGGFSRRRPRREHRFAERPLLSGAAAGPSIAYEEGRLALSDAHLVLYWLRSSGGTGLVMNYCRLAGGGRDGAAWRLELLDTLSGEAVTVSARCVINAAGAATDAVNRMFAIQSPHRHRLSKGVSINLPRHPLHRDTLIFDSARNDEGMTLVPWGPVAMWGSTEGWVEPGDSGAAPPAQRDEIEGLLNGLNRHLARPMGLGDIVSVRCGLRPLVDDGRATADPRLLSRRWCVHRDPGRPWISVYGGKITSAPLVAERVRELIRPMIHPTGWSAAPPHELPLPELERFGPLEQPVVSPTWSARYDHCRTLEDYLRRRTNIAQWVPRGGLGRDDEHLPAVRRIAAALCGGDEEEGDHMTAAYQRRIAIEFDALLGAGKPEPEPCRDTTSPPYSADRRPSHSIKGTSTAGRS